MTQKIKERLVNLAITVVTSFGAVFLSFALFAGERSAIRINNELREKAPFEYVDRQDAAIMSDLNTFKVEQNDRHNQEYKVTQDKLDIIIRWIESK